MPLQPIIYDWLLLLGHHCNKIGRFAPELYRLTTS